jgi:MoaA/NifB/PqqE/SkfB family radical SAM enzyme
MNPSPATTSTSAIEFSAEGHYFTAQATDEELDAAIRTIDRPLSVIYQVTRRCNFDCDFCSETARVKDPTLEEIGRIQCNLRGVQRVFLSGGEPLLRKDFMDIVSLFEEHIIGVPTNATRGHALADQLAGRVAFVNIGLEGPRSTTNRVRGDYDKIMRGVDRFRSAGLPLSVSAVVMRSLVDALPFTYQIADVIGAGKLKLIHPIRKGNGLHMADQEFLSLDESAALFERLRILRETHEWAPALRMTTWTPDTEGYSILVYPEGTAWAWPVYGGMANRGRQGGPADKVAYLGDLREEPIEAIWSRYTFKHNHVRKYLGRSIAVLDKTR